MALRPLSHCVGRLQQELHLHRLKSLILSTDEPRQGSDGGRGLVGTEWSVCPKSGSKCTMYPGRWGCLPDGTERRKHCFLGGSQPTLKQPQSLLVLGWQTLPQSGPVSWRPSTQGQFPGHTGSSSSHSRAEWHGCPLCEALSPTWPSHPRSDVLPALQAVPAHADSAPPWFLLPSPGPCPWV